MYYYTYCTYCYVGSTVTVNHAIASGQLDTVTRSQTNTSPNRPSRLEARVGGQAQLIARHAMST